MVRRFSLTRWARWAAAFALLSPALANAKPIEAGWVNETIPKALGGAARETFLFNRMRQRAVALEPKGQVEMKRATEKSGEKDLFIVESKTTRRHHYLMFVHVYRRVSGGFGPSVRLCRVSVDAHAMSFLVATDILRNGDCRDDAPRSAEYQRWVAEAKYTP